MKFGKSHLVNLAMIVALIAIAFVGHRLSPLLLPKVDVAGTPQPGCDLQQSACPATLSNGGRIELSITPRPIPLLKALRTEVTVSGIEASAVVVDFSGATMNMGYNRSELSATSPGRFAGEASLPVCVSGGMTWVATVIIETNRQRIAVPYRFDVGH